MSKKKAVVVSGSFDDFRAGHARFLQEASRLGPVHVLLWSDEVAEKLAGKPPKFPEAERLYLLQAIRYVDRVSLCHAPFDPDTLPTFARESAAAWVVDEAADHPAKRAYCDSCGLEYRVLEQDQLQGFPTAPPADLSAPSSQKRVIVTGCFDWFHSGHVRFFEEVSELGDLYVIVGHDANIRLLKGEGHPLLPEAERRYIVGAVRFVKQALISSGHGWLDAEPEIGRIRPHIYAVNEDGDRPEKEAYCRQHGIQYAVLKRVPKEGLPRRQSTDLRGF
jgi:cytidyltransferase-like protein